MSKYTVDGLDLARMLTGAVALLAQHVQEINDLNVFPVADGDTGTNMMRTVEGGLSAIAQREEPSLCKVSDLFSGGALLGARGNSGVILSQFFAGVHEGLASHGTAGAAILADAYQKGVAKAYASVQNPTEGTILTVLRESVAYASSHLDSSSSVEDFYRLLTEEARRSLRRTPELLPALAEAEVIDSGGAGFLYLIQGMYSVLTGQEPVAYVPTAVAGNAPDLSRFTRDSRMELGYCTECMLRLTDAKCDPDLFQVSTLTEGLKELGGESIVAYKKDDIIKLHVHTLTPGAVLELAQRYGEFLTVKVENMALTHSDTTKVKKPKKPYSVVAVASGEGISALFEDMGCDVVVSGGQTSNPSAGELIDAFRACSADTILVLPNNKNVILTAHQAAEMYGDARVVVIETASLMQGYAALAVITPGVTDMDALVAGASRAAAGVVGIEITRAVRDATVDGRTVCEGEYMAIGDHGLLAVADTPEQAAFLALEGEEMDLMEVVTLFVGKAVTEEQRAAFSEELEDRYPDCELTVYRGGQDVYEYLIALE